MDGNVSVRLTLLKLGQRCVYINRVLIIWLVISSNADKTDTSPLFAVVYTEFPRANVLGFELEERLLA